jgi:predicted small metal-binding protein
MRILRCSDVGERTCNYIAEGATDEETERNLIDHARERHPIFIESMDQDDYDHFFKQMDAMIERH